VVLLTTADAQADREPSPGEQVTGGDRLREEDRVVQLRDQHGRDDLYPGRPRRDRAEKRECLGVVEHDPLAEGDRRPRPLVDRPRPRLEDVGVERRLHHRQGHPDVHPTSPPAQPWGACSSVITTAPPRPRLCCSASEAPSTCRAPARPRSCQLSSVTWAMPVAPSGCPLEIRPPDGLTTHCPPYVVAPDSASLPPCPGSHIPSPS